MLLNFLFLLIQNMYIKINIKITALNLKYSKKNLK